MGNKLKQVLYLGVMCLFFIYELSAFCNQFIILFNRFVITVFHLINGIIIFHVFKQQVHRFIHQSFDGDASFFSQISESISQVWIEGNVYWFSYFRIDRPFHLQSFNLSYTFH